MSDDVKYIPVANCSVAALLIRQGLQFEELERGEGVPIIWLSASDEELEEALLGMAWEYAGNNKVLKSEFINFLSEEY